MSVSRTLEPPRYLKRWPDVRVDPGKDMSDAIVIDVSARKGEGGGGVQLPDLRTKTLYPLVSETPRQAVRCESLGDVVVKHASSLLEPSRHIRDIELIERAKKLGAQIAFAAAYHSYARRGGGDFLLHAADVIGFKGKPAQRKRVARNIGRKYGFITEDDRIDQSTINDGGVFSDISFDMITELKGVPEHLQKNNLFNRLERFARAVVVQRMYEQTKNIKEVASRLGTGRGNTETRDLKLLADEWGVSNPRLTYGDGPSMQKKRPAVVRLEKALLHQLRQRVSKLANSVDVSGHASQNRIEQASAFADAAVVELCQFISGNAPLMGSKIAGVGISTYRERINAAGASVGQVIKENVAVDAAHVRVEGLSEDKSLSQHMREAATDVIVRKVWELSGHNTNEAGRILGVSSNTAHKYLRQAGIKE